MKSLFDSSGWGREQIGFTDDTGVFDAAAAAVGFAASAGLSPRAVTAVFFASGAVAAGGDPVYIQHVQVFEAAIAEGVLLDMVVQELSVVGGGQPGLVDDPDARTVNMLSAVMKVPAPPTTRWSGAVVALHIANALNVLRINVGVVRDPVACRYSVTELVTNASIVVRDMRSAELNRELR
ncbi:hypothetical protein [Mycobacteroides salmoniphilum]|uniref:hypothetical protein n=1 Tax=Mycobacteroides salmoniphilum TaxID=404941 RepID=UPI0010A9AFDC|nr:hypothetical protein [Mycobacteroides salmoniphilum]QCH25592.1 hypothetical protein DSM43276_03870 [Mycobacteroides salmoniphilum]